MIYEFGSFIVDDSNFLLLENGSQISLEPQVFDLLIYLIVNRDRIISRQEIIDNIWNGRSVYNDSINNRIKTLRKALGDSVKLQKNIRTIYSRGYRFVSEVTIQNSSHITTLIETSDKFLNKSIAVLAFDDMSANSDLEYLSDGISEEMINLLSRVSKLKVISRTSSFSYKGSNKDIREIANELGASHVLEGSIRNSDTSLRITAQLIQANDGCHLWSETYHYNKIDIFKIQDDIAASVTGHLQLTLLGDEIKTRVLHPDSYTFYLRARHLYQKFIDEAILQAEELARQAIALDDKYAPSWLLLSQILLRSTLYLFPYPQKKGLMLAEDAILNALNLDEENALYHAQFALIKLKSREFETSIKSINRARSLAEDDSIIIGMVAHHAMNIGRLDEALELHKKAIQLDPYVDINYYNMSIIYGWLGRYDEAMEAIKKYNQIRPDAALQHTTTSFILLCQGRKKEALKESDQEPHPFWKLYTQHCIYFSLNKTEIADKLLHQFIHEYSHNHPVTMAYIYSFRNEIDNAFKWLDIAFEKCSPNLTMKLNYIFFKNIHNDPRWTALIHKMNFPKGHWLLKQ